MIKSCIDCKCETSSKSLRCNICSQKFRAKGKIRLKRPCKNCQKNFTPTGKFSTICEKCRKKICRKNVIKNSDQRKNRGRFENGYKKSIKE